MELRDYIKLSEAATNGPWTIKPEINRNGTILTIAARFGQWTVARILSYVGSPKQVQNNAEFIAASRTLGPAMAQALIEVEEALHYYASGKDDGTRVIAAQALSTIQKLKEAP